jgi:hypothetical protein
MEKMDEKDEMYDMEEMGETLRNAKLFRNRFRYRRRYAL